MKRLVPIVFSILLVGPYNSYAHSWMAPERHANKENPVTMSRQSAANGKRLFENVCSSCHGKNAAGLPKQITGLNMDTPDLPRRLASHSDGDFHWKIINGREDMPSFGEELSETEIWDIINYIKILIPQ